MIQLPEAVISAAKNSEAMAAVAEVYADLAAAVAERKPICVISGRCCHFEAYGHRLYVSTLELARFCADTQPQAPGNWDGTGCPFQRAKLCGVHAARPMGCRIFFCDATSTAWQHGLYEALHNRLRGLHEKLNVPYYYVEWRSALREIGLAHG
jgi:Fe-S-cluster containining protein